MIARREPLTGRARGAPEFGRIGQGKPVRRLLGTGTAAGVGSLCCEASGDAQVPAACYPATPRFLARRWEADSVRMRMRAGTSGEGRPNVCESVRALLTSFVARYCNGWGLYLLWRLCTTIPAPLLHSLCIHLPHLLHRQDELITPNCDSRTFIPLRCGEDFSSTCAAA